MRKHLIRTGVAMVVVALFAATGAFAKPHVIRAGNLFLRDDGGITPSKLPRHTQAPISAHIAPEKAKTAALGRRESKIYEDMVNNGRMSFLSAPELQGMLEGGVPIVVQGHYVGAVGVSGVKSAEDVQIAKAGIAALGA